jgi:hypothetical protein
MSKGMSKGGFLISGSMMLVVIALSWGIGQAQFVLDPGGIPHYFGPYGNWAYSPLPRGSVASITLEEGGSGYSGTPTVTISDVYGTGSGATATATVDLNPNSPTFGEITAITLGAGGANYSAPIVIIDGTGIDAAASATIGGPFEAGSGIRKFVDKLPGLTSAGANTLVTPRRLGGLVDTNQPQYIPLGVPENFATPSLPPNPDLEKGGRSLSLGFR